VTGPEGLTRGKEISLRSLRLKKGSLLARRPGRPPKRGWRVRFLLALSKTGSQAEAARHADVARSTVIAWKAADPTFRHAVARAKRDAIGERLTRRYNANPTLKNLLTLLEVLRPETYGGFGGLCDVAVPDQPDEPG
jgi:hypothetical protein